MYETMDSMTKLRLAIAGSRHGHGDARLAAQARQLGVSAFADVFDRISPVERAHVCAEAEELCARGVSAVLLSSAEYPKLLSTLRGAPPSLLYMGPPDLMVTPSVGMCGSRNASSQGLRAAGACGEVAASLGLTVVSGYARGVDMSAHISALSAGGTTVIVLPEGIDRFRVKRGLLADVWDTKRALVVSQFAPTRPWSAGAAMARNSVIIGLSQALVVVEAQDRGGTLAAGKKALDLNRRVVALEFSQVPPGNAMLLQRGAISARSRSELATCLRQITDSPGESQLSLI